MHSKYLLRRNRHYFFRLHIPLDLRSWFGGRRDLASNRVALLPADSSEDISLASVLC
jgi:hypothetical protein